MELTTFTLFSGLVNMGPCEGCICNDREGDFIFFLPEMYRIINPGDTLIDSSNNVYSVYLESPVVDKNGNLTGIKYYYR